MKNRIFLVAVCLLLVAVMLFSCTTPNTTTTTTVTKPDIQDVIGNIDTDIDDNDTNSDYSDDGATMIAFSKNDVSVKGMGAAAQGSTVKIGSEGTYIFSGSCDDGYVIVDANKAEIKIVLEGLTLSNNDGPAIIVKNAKKVTVTLAEGTDNYLADGASYQLTEGNATVDGAIFSKAELVINGAGNLTVNGNNAHGIVSKKGLVIAGGNLSVKSKSAGICGKDYLKITNSNITINAGTDGLKSDNMEDSGMGYVYIQSGSFDITSANDAIQAYHIASIEGGTFNIKTTSTLSTASAKGVKGVTGVAISGGTFTINAQDDGIHSDGDVMLSGGNISISSADDGVHANDKLDITGGELVIAKSYEGLEATEISIYDGVVVINSSDDGMNASGGNDENTNTSTRPGGDMFESSNGAIAISGGYLIIHAEGDGIDANGSIEMSGGVVLVDGPSRGGNGSMDYNSTASITGGVFIALGTRDMAQNFKSATQGSFLLSSSGSFSAGTLISVCDEKGNVIAAFRSTKTFNCVTVSAPELKQGETYTLYKNANVDGLDENGFAHNTTQTGGETCGTVTLSSLITGSGSSMGGFPGGGGRPPR